MTKDWSHRDESRKCRRVHCLVHHELPDPFCSPECRAWHVADLRKGIAEAERQLVEMGAASVTVEDCATICERRAEAVEREFPHHPAVQEAKKCALAIRALRGGSHEVLQGQ